MHTNFMQDGVESFLRPLYRPAFNARLARGRFAEADKDGSGTLNLRELQIGLRTLVPARTVTALRR